MINFCHFLIQSSENLYTRKERRGPHDAQTHAGPLWAVENHLGAGALPPIILTSSYPSSFRTPDDSSPDNSLPLPKSAALPILTTRVRTCIRYKTQIVTLKMFTVCFVLFLFLYICFQTMSDNSCKESVFKDVSITLPKLNSCIFYRLSHFLYLRREMEQRWGDFRVFVFRHLSVWLDQCACRDKVLL